MVVKKKSLNKIIKDIVDKPKQRVELFRKVSTKRKRAVVLNLSKSLRTEILLKLEPQELIEILEHLDVDEATEVLNIFPAKEIESIIAKLNEGLKNGVNFLLQFGQETAAGLMNINYIQVEHDDTIFSVSKQVKVHEGRTGKIPAILVMKEGDLIGYLPGYDLGFGQSKDTAKEHVKKITKIKASAEIDEVLRVFRKNARAKVVVIGQSGNVMGVIYSDDILKIINQRQASSLYGFAGVSKEETIYDTAKQKVANRYKWLVINLGTAILASFAISLFDKTISKYVILAVYMPIIAGMGGNAGTQTLAVMVRGISFNQLGPKTIWRTLKNEIIAGAFNGLIIGALILSILVIFKGDLKIGLILSIALVINFLVSSTAGTLVPVIMKKLGKDPASSASIFITTATDVLGFVAFLGLATLFLR